jgi:hypothetical protein
MCQRRKSASGVTPLAWGTVTEYLPCLSEAAFVEVVMYASRLSGAGACNLGRILSAGAT